VCFYLREGSGRISYEPETSTPLPRPIARGAGYPYPGPGGSGRAGRLGRYAAFEQETFRENARIKPPSPRARGVVGLRRYRPVVAAVLVFVPESWKSIFTISSSFTPVTVASARTIR
jgi:hypothetical protein